MSVTDQESPQGHQSNHGGGVELGRGQETRHR